MGVYITSKCDYNPRMIAMSVILIIQFDICVPVNIDYIITNMAQFNQN